MNKKGFTLIELIVAIAIMGIVMVIAFPVVNIMRDKYAESKYKAYYKTLERAAKLYVDSNSKEMFGNFGSGCDIVLYTELEDANLIKDYSEKDKCDDKCVDEENTFVLVEKKGDEYEYKANLVLTNGWKSEPQYDRGSCELKVDTDSPILTVSPESSDYRKTDDVPDIEVSLSDGGGVGLDRSVSVKYNWVKEGAEIEDENWKTLVLTKNKNYKKKISRSVYPSGSNASGLYYLVFDVSGVEDLAGNSMGNQLIETKTAGYYKIDNTPPSCSITHDANVTNNVPVTLGYSDGHSGVKEWDLTTSDTASYSKRSSAVANTPGNHTYYGYVKDNAGNTSTCNESVDVAVAGAPPTPTCAINVWTASDLSRYNSNKTTPNTASGRGAYGGGWSKYPVIVTPRAGSGTPAGTTYQITVTGKSSNVTNANFTYRNIIANGETKVKCRACNAGKCSPYSANATIKVDKIAPTCSVGVYSYSSSKDAYVTSVSGWTNKNVKVKAVCSDSGGSGCTGNTKLKDTGLKSDKIDKNTNAKKNASSNNSVVYVRDNAGNSTKCNSVTVKVDKTSPTCSSSKSNTNKTNGVTATFKCSDKGGSGVKSCTSKKTGLKSSHSYTIKDKAGNSGTCSVSVSSKCSQYYTCQNSACGTSRSCKDGNTCIKHIGKKGGKVVCQCNNPKDPTCESNFSRCVSDNGASVSCEWNQVCTTVTKSCATSACGCKTGVYY